MNAGRDLRLETIVVSLRSARAKADADSNDAVLRRRAVRLLRRLEDEARQQGDERLRDQVEEALAKLA